MRKIEEQQRQLKMEQQRQETNHNQQMGTLKKQVNKQRGYNNVVQMPHVNV